MNTNRNSNPHANSCHRRSGALGSCLRAKQVLSGVITLAGSICLLGPALPSAMAQCTPEWSDAFTPAFFEGGSLASSAIYDDGSGPKLLIAGLGRFGQSHPGIQVWDGQAWSTIAYPDNAVGEGDIVGVRNDPSNPWILLADQKGYAIQGVYIYQNGSWSNLQFPARSSFSPATAIIADPDPQSHDIYLVGAFRNDDRSFTYVFRWDGSQWHPLDTSSEGASVSSAVWFDDGSGLALYVSVYHGIDGQSIPGSVAKWDGSTWSQVGPTGSPVSWPSLAVFDDGTGPALWALDSSGDTLAKWDGSSWTSIPLEPSESSAAWNLTGVIINNTQELVWTGSIGSVWRWDGIDGEKIAETDIGSVVSLVQDISGNGLIASGSFLNINTTQTKGVARYDGSLWTPVGESAQTNNGAPAANKLLAVGHTNNPHISNRLFVVTDTAGGKAAHGIAAWDNTHWQSIGADYMYANNVNSLIRGDLGQGDQLFAAGRIFPGSFGEGHAVMQWNGSQWNLTAGGIQNGSVLAMTVGRITGSQPTIYLGGDFSTINNESYYGIAALTSSGFEHLGPGFPVIFGRPSVNALAIHNDGSQVSLFAGGLFHYLEDQQLADSVIRWDGSSWSRVGDPLDNHFAAVNALLSADTGDGQRLYAAGLFGGIHDNLNNVAQWDGRAWLPLGEGLENVVTSLSTIDTPEGTLLAATVDDSQTTDDNDVYLWNGSFWEPMGINADEKVVAITQSHTDLDAIYVVGLFREINGVPSEGIARFGCTPDTCPVDFNSDNTVDTRDFVSFLNAWAADDDAADFNNDNTINSSDLTDFLNAWIAGC